MMDDQLMFREIGESDWCKCTVSEWLYYSNSTLHDVKGAPTTETMYIKGLLNVRKKFTEMFDHAKHGGEVQILHMGQNRKAEHGYKIVKMTDEELANHPDVVVKKDSIPTAESNTPRTGRTW